MARIFDSVAGNKPRLNRFDLSYTNTLSMAFGLLYPVQCDEALPGDVWKMSAFCHTELMPLVAPIMSDIQMFAHTFFVPYRILYGVDNEDGKSIFEKYITGGEEGDYDTPLTPWTPSWTSVGFSSRKIWDYVGNPVDMTVTGSGTVLSPYVYTWSPIVPAGLDVMIAPKYGYNAIYNAFYRDESLIEEVDMDNEDLLHVSFKKDYFTSALEAQQRGIAPALPVDVSFDFPAYSRIGGLYATDGESFVGSKVVIPAANVRTGWSGLANTPGEVYGIGIDAATAGVTPKIYGDLQTGNVENSRVLQIVGNGEDGAIIGGLDSRIVRTPYGTNLTEVNTNFTNAVKATTFTVSDLRLAFAIQRMQELTMRGGFRFTEWLRSHFNAYPTDARLDRPEYIGGCVLNVSVSSLTQNSETANTPQGTKTGIGHVDAVEKIGNYRVLEHGLIMTLVSIVPKPIYKQGINRQWLRQSRFDHYMPETAFLSEQGIYNCELWTGGSSDVDESGNALDPQIFGYQAHWNELRCKNNIVTGAVRTTFDYWTLARQFDTRPALNQDFIEVDEKDFNKIFAVQDEDPFIVSWSNLIDCFRPIPEMGVPGLIDHVYGGAYYG